MGSVSKNNSKINILALIAFIANYALLLLLQLITIQIHAYLTNFIILTSYKTSVDWTCNHKTRIDPFKIRNNRNKKKNSPHDFVNYSGRHSNNAK